MPSPGDIYNPWRMFHGCFVPNAVARCAGLSARAKLVFGRLCQYAGENGEAFPSYRSLAQEVGVQRRCAINAIQELEDFGLIKTINRWRCDGAPVSNSYVFLWHEIFQPSAHEPAPGVQIDTTGGVRHAPTPWCSNNHLLVAEKTPKKIQTKESSIEKTTTEVIGQLLAGTPLSSVKNHELDALAQRHGTKLLRLTADIAAETWRRDRGEISNPGGYLQSLCSALVIPGWYKPAEERQADARKKKQTLDQCRKQEAERQDARIEEHWQSLPTAEQDRFVSLVTAAYPTLQLPAVAITATAKTLAWEQANHADLSREETR